MIAQFLTDHPDIVSICYHTPWPGALDLLFMHNPVQNQARTDYYGIPYVPYAWFDGKIYAYEPTSLYWYEWAYDYVADDPTEVTLEPTGSWDPETGAVTFSVAADLGAELPAGDYRLQIVLVEDDVSWEAPNGQTSHDHVMRQMVPDEGGTIIILGPTFPQTHVVDVNFDLDAEYVGEHCEVVYFLQDDESQDVHQAGKVALVDLPGPTPAPDMTVAWQLGAGYPNPFNPTVTVPVRMPAAGNMEISVHAADGRRVHTLHRGSLAAGPHRFVWNGRDAQGRTAASGVYLVRARGGDRVESQRVVLVK